MLIHESHIAEHGEIRNTSPIASSRPIGLVFIYRPFFCKMNFQQFQNFDYA